MLPLKNLKPKEATKLIAFGMKIKVIKRLFNKRLVFKKINFFCWQDILTNKRRQYSDLAHKINETKSLIDKTRSEVDRKRNDRYQLGEFVNEIGETVIDEEEFALIKRLQDLKSKYRDDFDRWRELKAEIVYCQNLVEQCRQRLIQGIH